MFCLHQQCNLLLTLIIDFTLNNCIYVTFEDTFLFFQFCAWLKCQIQDQRNVVLTALLGLLYMACCGISCSTALPTLIVPFSLWMAS